jgi:hypothetical protein
MECQEWTVLRKAGTAGDEDSQGEIVGFYRWRIREGCPHVVYLSIVDENVERSGTYSILLKLAFSVYHEPLAKRCMTHRLPA